MKKMRRKLRYVQPTRLERLLARKKGLLLDVSLGGTPQPNSLTFVDLKRSPLKLPWPLPDHCVHTAVVTHVLEFVGQDDIFRWFDELHRVMRPGHVAYFSGPFGGEESIGWISDPQHKTRIVKETFAWLDPRSPIYALHKDLRRPQPRPWCLVSEARVPGTLGTISYNVTLQAQAVKP